MNATQKPVLTPASDVDAELRRPFAGSAKTYVAGSRPDIRVPMREVTQSATATQRGDESNESIAVYDTSGAYTDTTATINLRQGLPPIRAAWIAERADSEVLPGISSAYGRARAEAEDLSGLRFPNTHLPRRALAGHNVT